MTPTCAPCPFWARRDHVKEAGDQGAEAHEMAHLAADTIQSVAARRPDPALTASFPTWQRVLNVQEHLDRFRRG